ncbi:hypothetical protein GR927_30280 [Mycolicibacterium sp. 3033]|nr:hypothetical protein [Mycolicibacterium aurantiacum]
MSEVQVVEHVEVLVPLGESEAKVLDNKIASTVQAVGDRLALLRGYIEEAERGQIHRALGFDSWTSYVSDRLSGRWELKGDDRREMAQLLAKHGMSSRLIAEITGASKSAVARDIASAVDDGANDAPAEREATVPNGTVEPAATITSRNGKTFRRKPRPRPEPQPDPEPAKVERKIQIPTTFRSEAKMLGLTVALMASLAADPRWDKAKERFTLQDRLTLESHIATLQKLRAAMGEKYNVTPVGESA